MPTGGSADLAAFSQPGATWLSAGSARVERTDGKDADMVTQLAAPTLEPDLAEDGFGLTVQTASDGDVALVTLSGRLDATARDLLVGCCRTWVTAGIADVELDLAQVSGIDGPGTAALLRCRRLLRSRGGQLLVSNARPGVAERLAFTRLVRR
jgi:anti-anti-sigma factor